MNALNFNPRAPLVADIGRGTYLLVAEAHGFTLDVRSGRWQPVVDAVGIGGRVLKQWQIDELFAAYGRPL